MNTIHPLNAAKDLDMTMRRIRRLLEKRPAMHIGELACALGAEEDVLRAELDVMRVKGEVERLRPVGYTANDQDFFVVPPLPLVRGGTLYSAKREGTWRWRTQRRSSNGILTVSSHRANVVRVKSMATKEKEVQE